jgi:WD40 repeat protein
VLLVGIAACGRVEPTPSSQQPVAKNEDQPPARAANPQQPLNHPSTIQNENHNPSAQSKVPANQQPVTTGKPTDPPAKGPGQYVPQPQSPSTNTPSPSSPTGHTAQVNSVAFSPDGKTLATGSWDWTVKLWDVASGQNTKTLSAQLMNVYSVAFSPDGKTLAAGGAVPFPVGADPNQSGLLPGEVRLFDVASGKSTATLSTQCYVIAVAFSPDGKTLASYSSTTMPPVPGLVDRPATTGNIVKLWDVASGRKAASFSRTGGGSAVVSMTFSPDGRTLAMPSNNFKSIKLWDVANGSNTQTFKEPDGVDVLAFSPDGKTLASTSGSAIKLWDVASGTMTGTLTGQMGGVYSVAFSPDGKTLASGSDDNTIVLWNVVSGENTKTLTGHNDWVFSVAFSPDGKTLASGSKDCTVKLWDVATGKTTTTFGK